MKRLQKTMITHKPLSYSAGILLLTVFIYGCSSPQAGTPPQGPPQLPVMVVASAPATTYLEFPASLEGKVNVDVRPQVSGYLEKIYVDEGAYVKAGQPLFKIDPKVYAEQLNGASSNQLAAQANVEKAQVEVDRLAPLVASNVVSDVQLKTAKANYEVAKAALAQAKAAVGGARINVGYTLVTAPVSGYIGRIPYKVGALVSNIDAQPLTVLSEVREMYAYFSMSEADFITFKNDFPGKTLEEKLKNAPAVELILADNSTFAQKGRIGMIDGQFDKTTGAITFRAAFPNPDGVLRTGNTGKVRFAREVPAAITIPQEATFEIQDKVLVYTVADSNKVTSRPIHIAGKTANLYFVNDGLKAGEKIVLSGTANLKDGAVITPQPVPADSVLKSKQL
ncbi:efflux RND transporter periplasmic adaptor subunit [Chitinophaga sp. GCM10012297]|uniref:Efflux RND transporter periplasmic adaptor subunit n=1 Tax=Chitinophaga chungangae TaxID=2821488 RepID=A0ABS3YA24_9BACT|nr:efflux RND transporter periplasmic adaptor subunit [Chitinophaga chungangae]MBO9151519.1 efflux RND transporter periplasmic adaptor subunit [Chitinophaga chungangae]